MPTTRAHKLWLYRPPAPFGSSVPTTFACQLSRSLSQIQIPSPYQLPSTYPARGCQEGPPLANWPPLESPRASLHCQGSYFIHAPRSTWRHRWFILHKQLLKATSRRKAWEAVSLPLVQRGLRAGDDCPPGGWDESLPLKAYDNSFRYIQILGSCELTRTFSFGPASSMNSRSHRGGH